MSFINTIITSNRNGFKHIEREHGMEAQILHLKGNKPKKHENGKVSFFTENMRSDSPTKFTESTINRDAWKLKPKEFKYFSAKVDPFKKLFGYENRIEPIYSINPKYYEYNLANKSYNDIVKDNLAAEHGTYIKDVEHQEALKNFMAMKAERDARDNAATTGAEEGKENEPDDVAEVEVAAGGGVDGVAGGAAAAERGEVEIEPVSTVFDEYKKRTELPDQLTEEDIDEMAEEAEEYTKGIGDNSSIIKLNKLMAEFGIPKITGREKKPSIIKTKIALLKSILQRNTEDAKRKEMAAQRKEKEAIDEAKRPPPAQREEMERTQMGENEKLSKLHEGLVRSRKETIRKEEATGTIYRALRRYREESENAKYAKAKERKAARIEIGGQLKPTVVEDLQNRVINKAAVQAEAEEVYKSPEKKRLTDDLQTVFEEQDGNEQKIAETTQLLEELSASKQPLSTENIEKLTQIMIAMKSAGYSIPRVQSNTNWSLTIPKIIKLLKTKPSDLTSHATRLSKEARSRSGSFSGVRSRSGSLSGTEPLILAAEGAAGGAAGGAVGTNGL